MYGFPQITNNLSLLGAKNPFTFTTKNLSFVYIRQYTDSNSFIAVEYYQMTNKMHVALHVYKPTNRQMDTSLFLKNV